MDNPRISLSKKDFDKFHVNYPSNMVIVEMPPEKDILVSGIKVNFNPDLIYAEGTDSHAANCAETHGVIVKQVEKLYYNRKDIMHSMSWKTTLETKIGDTVFFHHLASKNCCEIDVEGVIHKVLNYEDLLVAKRDNGSKDGTKYSFQYLDEMGVMADTDVMSKHNKIQKELSSLNISYTPIEIIIPLNGIVILEEVYKPKLSKFDISAPEVDKYKGIVKYNGSENEEYIARHVADIKGLKEGDLVMIEPNSYPFYLERSKWNSSFDMGKQYLTSQKRHIQAVL